MNDLEGEFGQSNVTHVPDRLPMAPALPPPGPPPKYHAPHGGSRKHKKKKHRKPQSGRRSSKLAMNYGNIMNQLEGEFGTSNVTHVAHDSQGMAPPPPQMDMGAPPKYHAPLGGVK